MELTRLLTRSLFAGVFVVFVAMFVVSSRAVSGADVPQSSIVIPIVTLVAAFAAAVTAAASIRFSRA